MFLKIDFRKLFFGFTFIQKCGLILKLKMKTIVYSIVLLFLNGVLYVHTLAFNELILSLYSEQQLGQQPLCRQDGGMGHLASQLLIATQTVWILW